MDEKHIMINLGDKRAKEISEVIGNETCNKILDSLVENEGTVTELSKKLNVPINTIDYNIKKLVSVGLIEKSNYWWSVKGKKMPTYKVSDKKIIITPKSGMKKHFFATLLVTGLAALGIRSFMGPTEYAGENLAVETFSMPVADLMTETSLAAKTGIERSMDAVSPTVTGGLFSSLASWEWFLFGAWFAIVLFMIISIRNERRRK